MAEKLIVRGFSFDSQKAYEEAKKEEESIQYITSKIDLSTPENALKVYIKLLDKNNFHTIIGMTFLSELRNKILSTGIIKEMNLKEIETRDRFVYYDKKPGEESEPSETQKLFKEKENKTTALKDYYETKYNKAKVIILALAIVIIALFSIAIYNKTFDRSAGEIEIQNKYSAWAEELEQREADISARERALEQ